MKWLPVIIYWLHDLHILLYMIIHKYLDSNPMLELVYE